MISLLWLLLTILASPFKSKCQLEAENVALRHQVVVLRRQVCGRVRLTNLDRPVLVQLYRWFPSIFKMLAIVPPETVTRWHRAGFRRYWRRQQILQSYADYYNQDAPVPRQRCARLSFRSADREHCVTRHSRRAS
jgi:hypothetical protein